MPQDDRPVEDQKGTPGPAVDAKRGAADPPAVDDVINDRSFRGPALLGGEGAFSSAQLSEAHLSSTISFDATRDREALPQNFLSGSRYQCQEYINRGASSFVVMAVDTTTDLEYALKFIPIQATKSKYIEREILNQFKLRHPHVIKLEEFFEKE